MIIKEAKKLDLTNSGYIEEKEAGIEEKIEIAKKLLKQGVDISTIAIATGLSKEKIEVLEKNL